MTVRDPVEQKAPTDSEQASETDAGQETNLPSAETKPEADPGEAADPTGEEVKEEAPPVVSVEDFLSDESKIDEVFNHPEVLKRTKKLEADATNTATQKANKEFERQAGRSENVTLVFSELLKNADVKEEDLTADQINKMRFALGAQGLYEEANQARVLGMSVLEEFRVDPEAVQEAFNKRDSGDLAGYSRGIVEAAALAHIGTMTIDDIPEGSALRQAINTEIASGIKKEEKADVKDQKIVDKKETEEAPPDTAKGSATGGKKLTRAGLEKLTPEQINELPREEVDKVLAGA